MSQRILCTNGTRTRMMGVIELRQNPDWRPATDQDQNTGSADKPKAKEVRTPQPVTAKEVVTAPVVEKPKEVITAEVPSIVDAASAATNANAGDGERISEGNGEANEATEAIPDGTESTLSTEASGAGSDEATSAAATTTHVPPAPKQIGEVMKAVKACKNEAEVDEVIKDETRKAVLDVAKAHKNKLNRTSKP
jgi:hypothetical protein